MALRQKLLLLGGIGLMVAFAASESEAARRSYFWCYRPFGWQQTAPVQQSYQYDPATGAYRRYSFEPGAEATVAPAPTVSPAPTPSRTPSAGDTVRRRLRPGSGN